MFNPVTEARARQGITEYPDRMAAKLGGAVANQVEAYQAQNLTLTDLADMQGYTVEATALRAVATYRAMQRKGQSWADAYLIELARRLDPQT